MPNIKSLFLNLRKSIILLFLIIFGIAISVFQAASHVYASVIDDAFPPLLESFVSDPSTGSFTTGEVIHIYANFDEDLDPSSTMSITLNTGSMVSLDASNSGGCTVSSTQLCGTYTILNGENSLDLNITSINSANITDLDSTPNNNTSYLIPVGQNLEDNSSIVVNTIPANLTSFTSTATDGTYGTGANINITAHFDKDITPGSTMEVVLDTGAYVVLDQVSGATLSGSYVVASNQNSGDMTVSSISSASVMDISGNNITNYTVPSAPNNIADTSDIVVSTVGPALASFTSTSTNGTYGMGANINITAHFDKDIASGSVMEVVLDSGAYVMLDQVSGMTLSGTYIVAAGENSGDITVSSVSSASVTDIFGNNITSYSIPGAPNNIADTSDIVISTTGPSLTSFTSTATDGTYGTGANINITAHFDKDITPGSTMEVVLDTGAYVVLDQVSGATLSGSYVVASNQNSGDMTVSSISSASVMDISGNNITSYTVPSAPNNIADTSDIIIATQPIISSADVNDSTVTLTYSKTLDTSSVPASGDFVVYIHGTSVTISSVSITGSTALIHLANPALINDTVTLDYTPGSSPIQDVYGNSATSLSAYSVFNKTITSSTISVGGNPQISIAVGGKLYVANTGADTVSVIDTHTYAVIATIPVGGSPAYLSAIGNKVYVNNQSSDSVSVIDTTDLSDSPGGTVIATIPVEDGPYASLVVGNKLYVTNYYTSKSVSVIDTSNLSYSPGGTVIATIPVGGSPAYLSVVGTKVYVNDSAANIGPSGVSVIDTSNLSYSPGGTVIATISVGDNPYISTLVGNKLYVLNRASNNVSVIDTTDFSDSPAGTVIATIPVGLNPQYIRAVGTKLYINNTNSNSVSVIDTSNLSYSPGGTVIATIPVGLSPYGSQVFSNKVFITNEQSNSVSVIDTTDLSDSPGGTVIATIPVGGTPFNISIFGTKLYVNNVDSNNVSVIDLPSHTLVNVHSPNLVSITSTTINGNYSSGQTINITAHFNTTIRAGSKMRLTLNTGAVVDLATVSGSTLSGTYTVGSGEYTPDLSVSSISSNPSSTSVSNTSSPANIQTVFTVPISPDLTGDASRNLGDFANISIGTSPFAIGTGVNPYQMVTVGNLTYVANQGSNSVTIFNNSTNSVVATTTVGSQPYGMAYNATSKEIYVANLKGNSVSVIDADPASGTFNTVTHTISSGMGIEPYYVASLGTKIYVTNNISWTVSVIDTVSHTVSDTISVGANPRGIKALGTKLYVANFGSDYDNHQAPGTVSVIDTASGNSVTTISVGSGPRGVAVNGTDVYVANFNDNTVSRIDTMSGNSVSVINVGTNPRGILGLNNKMYIENYQDGTISVIDGTTHAVTGTYKVGNTPAGMVAIGNDVAISRFTDGVVSIFDTNTLALKSGVFSDVVPPVISLIATSTTATTSLITFMTDESATSTISYGTTTSYGYTSTATIATTTHAITVSGLTSSTIYHYQITAIDGSGNIATTSDNVFVTNDDSVVLPSDGNGSVSSSVSYGGGGSGGGSSYFESVSSLNTHDTTSVATSSPILSTTTPYLANVSLSKTVFKTSQGGPFVFKTSFSVSSKSNLDIQKLQKFLNTLGFTVSKTGPGSSGKETSVFGLATKAALIKFQKANHIQPAIGTFGPITRAYVNNLIEEIIKK